MGNIHSDSGVGESLINHDEQYKDESHPSSVIIENRDGWNSIKHQEKVTSEYKTIKEDLLREGAEAGKKYVYVDQTFPAAKQSLYKDGMQVAPDYDYIEWERPHRLSSRPSMFRDGISSEDINQGMLGNCWWLSSCASISQSKRRMEVVIPSGQSFYGEAGYVGAFHFRFWQFGRWVDIIVDDKLPHIRGKLCFAHSTNRNEYWICLLEKAYAKLMGCYAMCEGGQTNEALEDLTGGLAITYKLKDKTPSDFERILYKALRNNTFVGAGITGEEGANHEDRRTGLISAHAYSVLQFARVRLLNGKVESLVKVRNPWGGSFEWTAKYSDESRAWDMVSDSDKDKLGYEDRDNGEWWMTFGDFCKYYDDATLCTMGPDFNEDGQVTGDRWLLSTIRGCWDKTNSGGSRNNVDMYARNPQYLIEFNEPDDFDADKDDAEDEGKCSLVIGLMQNKRPYGLKNEFIGFNLYREYKEGERLSGGYFERYKEVATSGIYTNIREVTASLQLRPGRYVLVPSTYEKGCHGDFLVRMYTEKAIHVTELE